MINIFSIIIFSAIIFTIYAIIFAIPAIFFAIPLAIIFGAFRLIAYVGRKSVESVGFVFPVLGQPRWQSILRGIFWIMVVVFCFTYGRVIPIQNMNYQIEKLMNFNINYEMEKLMNFPW